MDGDLSRDELVRYGRHVSIPEVGLAGQRRLRASSVLIVGAGGLGSPAALYLAAAGVGRLGLVDHDRVELSNLQRQVLYDTDAVGTPKLASARARLTGLNPDVAVETFETRMDSRNAFEILEGWDFVIDGSDNFPTRYLVNDACVMLGTPFAYGAILRFEGQASVFGAPDGPCYRCLFRDPPPPGLVPNCAEAGVLGVLPGIVGSIQANEAIKWLTGIGDTLAGRLLLIDALRMEFRSLDIAPDPECAVCGPEPTVTELIDYERFCGAPPDGTETEGAMHDLDIDVHELKRRIDAGERFQLIDVREDYEWAICNLEEAGARLVPLATLPEAVESLDASEPLIIHCRSGPRGDRAVEYLRAAGFDNAVNLAGGILAWAEEIDPAMPQY
ncbi:molybdopterin-synthase adenylyltransferase MoeB [Candidatus Palauibacter polyketidifaciens]|uniref:molybdopterin-synthase adenylyltransferase MoeB n=1 Tax=Candidatus Palauibacter polyketidifaciens TaxID=3056740 RepID=UPI002398C7A5|nr:molybdopterin-synthase adenylyltransferase MoeB [Candidatus Palauibacter polyketidifaciens]MDE2719943.1 molybdopterin-synthase adenylyltransferase MoeB [Candidatus Palauibacter polyketidifaciens]